MLDRAESTITRELDIVRFVQQLRRLRFTAIAKLTTPQISIVSKLGHLLIRDSSDLEDNKSCSNIDEDTNEQAEEIMGS